MKKDNLLTIGEVSKISGIHVKSLRYYDSIGVLKPVYIDPYTGYRYYSYSQLSIVEAIRTCIELDIPLKEFSEYSGNGGQKIYYAKLLERGKQLAERKFRSIMDGLEFIDHLQIEITRNESIPDLKQPIVYDMPKGYFFTRQFDPPFNEKEFNRALGELYLQAAGREYKPGYEFGLLYRYTERGIMRYYFINLLKPVNQKDPGIMVLPAGKYYFKHSPESSIDKAEAEFPELFSGNKSLVAIESELFTGVYNIDAPQYELRCSVLKKG